MLKNVFDVNVRGHPSPVTIDINRFFAWIIAGPSGSGKSTFIRRLVGLISFHFMIELRKHILWTLKLMMKCSQ